MFRNIHTIICSCLLLLFFLPGCAAYSTNPPVTPLPAKFDVASGAEATQYRTDNGLTLFAQWWLPANTEQVKAVVLLAHGSMVHSGFYSDWANFLVANNYGVLGVDLRGWGQSQGRGRRGFVNDVNLYVDDLQLAYDDIKQRFNGLPVFLQGESLGGAVVLLSQVQGRLTADGLVLNAPAVQPALTVASLQTPAWLAEMSLWFGAFSGEILPNHPVLMPGFISEVFTGFVIDDDELDMRYKTDKHVMHDAIPLSYFTGIKQLSDRLQPALSLVSAPTLIVQGQDDVFVPLSSSEFVLQQIGSVDRSLYVYANMNHATLHDTGHQQVWADTLSWLDDQLP